MNPLSHESKKIFMWVKKHCSSFSMLVRTHRLGFLYESKTNFEYYFYHFQRGELVCAFVGVSHINSAAEYMCGCSVSDHY